jgi:hypothetical protein
MTALSLSPARLALVGAAIAVIASAAGYGLASLKKSTPARGAPSAVQAGRKALYWYDPMNPAP